VGLSFCGPLFIATVAHSIGASYKSTINLLFEMWNAVDSQQLLFSHANPEAFKQALYILQTFTPVQRLTDLPLH